LFDRISLSKVRLTSPTLPSYSSSGRFETLGIHLVANSSSSPERRTAQMTSELGSSEVSFVGLWSDTGESYECPSVHRFPTYRIKPLRQFLIQAGEQVPVDV